MNYKSFGKRINSVRKSRNLTAEKLAEILNIEIRQSQFS